MNVREKGREAPGWAVWLARAAFGTVFAVNVVCALQFVFDPLSYAPGFQLEGVSGSVAVRGLGVAFLMWNATYPFFVCLPRRNLVVGVIVLAQQAIGCVGEACILAGLPPGYDVLAASIQRFIVFDVVGLGLMALSFACLVATTRRGRSES